MANFKNDKSGKLYRSTKNIKTEFDASGDNTIDGRIHELLPEKEALGLLPARIKKGGDQAKFFPELEQESGAAGILTGSIVRDTERVIFTATKENVRVLAIYEHGEEGEFSEEHYMTHEDCLDYLAQLPKPWHHFTTEEEDL